MSVRKLSSIARRAGITLFATLGPHVSAADLVTSVAASIPGPALALAANPAVSTASLPVSGEATAGQSFSLAASAEVSGLVVRIASVAEGGRFVLEVHRGMDGLPWQPDPVLAAPGALPAGLERGGLLRIDLPIPLVVRRGTHTVTLRGLGATRFEVATTSGSAHRAGTAFRRTPGTGGAPARSGPEDADLAFAILGTMGEAAPAPPAGAPNVVFILADDLGWTDLRIGGNGPNVLDGVDHGTDFHRTPNLARLAAEGLSFTHCFAHPNCAPTRAALLSGHYAPRSGNGVYVVGQLAREAGRERPTALVPPPQREDVPASHTVYPEVLQAGGYVTAHLGKYHVGNHEGGAATLPENQGFDLNFGGDQHGSPGAYHARNGRFAEPIGPGLDAWAQDYDARYVAEVLEPVADGNDPASLAQPGRATKHVEDALGDAAIAFLDDHRNGALAHRPFYLQLHTYAVHTPISESQARADLLDKFRDMPAGRRHRSKPYAAILENLDQTVGRLLEYLDDPDGDGDTADSIAGRTLVVFTSDNGGHVGPTDNDPLRHRKGSFYNGGLRVPLIVRQPGTVPAGAQTDTLVHSVDFYPTLVEHAGLPLPEELTLDGTSFAAHLTDPAGRPRDREPIFYHFPGYLDQRARPCSVAVGRIDGRDYKLIHTADLDYTGNPSSEEDRTEGLKPLEHPWELYAYSDDLAEATNLLDGDPVHWQRHGRAASILARELADWLRQAGDDWRPARATVRGTSDVVPFPDPESLPRP